MTELLGLHLATGNLLELQDQVDGIEAVDVEVRIQIGIRHDLLGRQLEQLGEHPLDLPEYFFFAVHRFEPLKSRRHYRLADWTSGGFVAAHIRRGPQHGIDTTREMRTQLRRQVTRRERIGRSAHGVAMRRDRLADGDRKVGAPRRNPVPV